MTPCGCAICRRAPEETPEERRQAREDRAALDRLDCPPEVKAPTRGTTGNLFGGEKR